MSKMKETYANYVKRTPNENEDLWKNALITFDTNVLIGFYSQSTKAKELIFSLIDKLKNRIFLTHQVGLELHENRYEIISNLIMNHEKRKDELDKIIKNLLSNEAFPHLDNETKRGLSIAVDRAKGDIKKSKKEYEELRDGQDIILERIHSTFDNSIESALDSETFKSIEIEGKKRYDNKIPPGYLDTKKDKNKYGDLIIWKQILRKAKDSKQSIIFVTEERKDDWWWKIGERKIGPRPELLNEIRESAGVNFQLSSTKNFLVSASKLIGEPVSEQTINELYSPINGFTYSIRDFYDNFKKNNKTIRIFVESSKGGDIDAQPIVNLATSIGFEVNPMVFVRSQNGGFMLELYSINTNNIRPLREFVESLGYIFNEQVV